MNKAFFKLISMALLAGFISTSALGGGVMAMDGKMIYDDVPESHWAFEYIVRAQEKGLIIETGETEFQPDKNIGMAEFIQMITANLALPDGFVFDEACGDTILIMPRVDEAVAKTRDGMLDRSAESEVPYTSETPITREAAASVLAQTVSYLGIMMTMQYIDFNGIFEDFNQVDPKYVSAMQTVCRLGILSGTAKATLSPKEPVTHAQAVVMLVRLLDIAD